MVEIINNKQTKKKNIDDINDDDNVTNIINGISDTKIPVHNRLFVSLHPCIQTGINGRFFLKLIIIVGI